MSTDTILPKEAIGPTIQRITKAGPHYQPPRTDRDTARPYARVIPWYELLFKQRSLTKEQTAIAVRVDHYWHKASDELFLSGSYGDQRWNGTPASQVAHIELEPIEWRQVAVKRMCEVKAHLEPIEWRTLEHAISQNASLTEVGRAFGKSSEAWARRWASTQITTALDKIDALWQIHARPA